MPTNRRRIPRSRTKIDIPDYQIKYLETGQKPTVQEDFFDFLYGGFDQEEIWREVKAQIMARCKPGTRPFGWWKFDSPKQPPKSDAWFEGTLPQPRQQVSGSGIPDFEKYPVFVPAFVFGVPSRWYQIDRSDPPYFEAQATYLVRMNLLTLAERRKLTEKDYEPESLFTIIGDPAR